MHGRSRNPRLAVAKDINDAVREVCLSFPEAEEFSAHGSPNFRVRGKTFAMYTVNHHGDGRVSLWLNSPPGAQDVHIAGEPKRFFVPPYVGPRGWLGVHLDKGLSWKLTAEQMDPMQSTRGQRALKIMRKVCLALPETTEGEQFGSPVWRAGKKSFALAYFNQKRLKVSFWVGVDRQGLLTADERFSIPPYMGHIGWIALDANDALNEGEVRDLALPSYHHFANRRMLTALESPGAARSPSRSKRKS